jgi:hypothetical protein
MRVRDSDVLAWVRGQRKMSQVLSAFGLLDFTMLRPVLPWRAFWNLRTVYFFNFQIFFRAAVNRGYWISGYGGTTVFTACVLCQLAATRIRVDSSTTCSSSGGVAQTALGILRVCYVSWLLPGLEWIRALLAHLQEGCTNGTWYTACVLCQLAITRVGVDSSTTCSSSGGAERTAFRILCACYVTWLLPEAVPLQCMRPFKVKNEGSQSSIPPLCLHEIAN